MKEIGGSRYIDRRKFIKYNEASTDDLCKTMHMLGFSGKDNIFLSSGRSAEKLVLDMIKDDRKMAILPAFTCETVILPFIERGYSIKYYHIDSDFKINFKFLDELIAINRPSIVLYHGIWGFNSCDGIDNIINKYQQKGIVFIEDRTFDIFNMKNYSDKVNFTIGSFRKLYVVPDGGFVFSKSIIEHHNLNEYNYELEQEKLNAYLRMYEYRVNRIGTFEYCQKRCAEAEEILENDEGFRMISPVSKKIICSSKLNEIKEKRRANYIFLYEELSNIKEIRIITPKLNENIVPYHFALCVDNKISLFEYLHRHKIYPTNPWNTFKYIENIEMNQFERELYNNCFFLEISDIYNIDDMKRMVDLIKEYFSVD